MVDLNKLISSSKTTEVYAAVKTMIVDFDKGDWSTETKLTSIFDELKPLNTALEKAINEEKAISSLDEKDEVRDEMIQAIYYTITGFLYSPVQELKSAALAVDKVFSRYGLKIIKESYSVESGFVDSMLTEFESADIQASIDALPGLRVLITGLKTAEAEFENAKHTYDKEVGNEKGKDSASEIKKTVRIIVNEKLVVYLRAMCTMDEPVYGEITNTIRKIIDDNNEQVKKRRVKIEPKKDPEAE